MTAQKKPYLPDGRKLAFPEANAFWDIFETCLDKAHAPASEPWRIEDYSIRTGQRFKATVPIGPYCGVSGIGSYYSLYVRARPEVYEHIKRNLFVSSRDSISFKVIVRDDGTALITAENSLILGSTWLAIVDANTIPPDPEP